ncbi:hypothetical protein GCM10027612_12870 [Microbispora bryophytorum subsp. camponoti]
MISTAATANMTPLVISTQPLPIRTTAPPLSTRPAIFETLVPIPSRALALCNRPGGTTSRMIPVSAGNNMAPAMPLTALATRSGGRGAHFVSIIAARQRWAAALTDSAAVITRCLGIRSATTPPSRRKATIGSAWAARTADSVVALAPGSARTPKVRAMGAKPLPSTEMVRAASNRANRRSLTMARSPPSPWASPIRSGGEPGSHP